MSEAWRRVRTYPYEVSSMGRVRNASTKRVLTPAIHNGYKRVSLFLNRMEKRSEYVHRLVALAFCGDPPTIQHEVNHIDGDKLNNACRNIEWATRSENIRHSFQVLGRRAAHGEQNGKTKLTAETVRAIRRLCAAGVMQKTVADNLGIPKSTVHHIVHRRSWAYLA